MTGKVHRQDVRTYIKPVQKYLVLKSLLFGLLPYSPQKSCLLWSLWLFSTLLRYNKIVIYLKPTTWFDKHTQSPPIDLNISQLLYIFMPWLCENIWVLLLVDFNSTIQCFWNFSWIQITCVVKGEQRLCVQITLRYREVNESTHQIELHDRWDFAARMPCTVSGTKETMTSSSR